MKKLTKSDLMQISELRGNLMKKTNKKPVLGTITQSVAASGQSVKYLEVFTAPSGVRFQVSIKSDAYDIQSFARISRWDGDKWQLVHHIHHAVMKTAPALVYLPNNTGEDARHFQADREELVRVALAVTA